MEQMQAACAMKLAALIMLTCWCAPCPSSASFDWNRAYSRQPCCTGCEMPHKCVDVRCSLCGNRRHESRPTNVRLRWCWTYRRCAVWKLAGQQRVVWLASCQRPQTCWIRRLLDIHFDVKSFVLECWCYGSSTAVWWLQITKSHEKPFDLTLGSGPSLFSSGVMILVHS